MTRRIEQRICITPALSGVGGMVSFRRKLEDGLTANGILISQGLEDHPYQSILVIGGTKQVGKLWRASREGARIVQRLDGMNWMHRRVKTGLRHFLRAEYGNLILRFIRSNLADRIIYQSQFACNWWERTYGSTQQVHRIIYNGVDLSVFSPGPGAELPQDFVRLLVVEGSLLGGYEMGLEHAMRLASGIAGEKTHAHSHNSLVELMVVGKVPEKTRLRWDNWIAGAGLEKIRILWAGLVPHQEIPQVDRSANLLFSSDLNAACPNSVIEALACGLPVVAFDTGALPELVSDQAGKVVPYGGDPWRLDPPNLGGLIQACCDVLIGGDDFRLGARSLAEEKFGLDKMVDAYVQVLFDE